MKREKLYILLALFSIFLAACGNSPEGAAKKWFNATMNLDGNTTLELTCEAQRENIQNAGLLTSAMALVPQAFGINMESQGDVSDVKFSTTSNDGNTAYVYVTGEIRMAILAFAQATPIDETWRMVNEDGKWKWCGE